MTEYVARRVLLMVPIALFVSVVVFLLLRLSPGDPVLVYAGEEHDPQSLAQIRHSLGLDQPLPIQYVAWLTHALQGDFGHSIRTHQPVLADVVQRVPATLELGGAAIFLSITLSLVIGTLSAVKHNSALDLLATGFTLASVSLPNFFLGLILILVLGLVLRLLPPGGYVPFADDPLENLRHLILPAITLASASTAVNLRQVRSSLLDVLGQDYVRTARAKGLAERRVIIRHALRNALIPVVTIVGIQVGGIIEGAFITETIFFWPGIGRLAVDSIGGRDYPVVQAVVLFSALAYMSSTLVVDLLYAVLDPRISYRARVR